jgi:hypothetical protein
MQENVKIVPSFATNFTVYAMPPPLAVKVEVNPDGTGNVSLHADCTASTYGGFCEGHPAVVGCVLTPPMKKSAKVIGAAPSFLMVMLREPAVEL